MSDMPNEIPYGPSQQQPAEGGPAYQAPAAYQQAPAQPAAQPPVPYQQAAPQAAVAWTGAQKAGWFFVGLAGGLLGILLASLTNVGRPDRSTATKMAVFGAVAIVAVVIVMTVFTACVSLSIATASLSYY